MILAKKNEGLIVPGYTHLQRAQPILLQHLLLAYVEQVCINSSMHYHIYGFIHMFVLLLSILLALFHILYSHVYNRKFYDNYIKVLNFELHKYCRNA